LQLLRVNHTKIQLKSYTHKLGFEEILPKFHQTNTQGLGSFKQVLSNPLLKENTRLNSHFKILTKNHKIMSLVFYLKTIGKNVDPSARIMFPKTDRRLNRWIFVDQGFCRKTQGKTWEGVFVPEWLRGKMGILPI
jgi:hypothetical protein